jgi:hypothetical protein
MPSTSQRNNHESPTTRQLLLLHYTTGRSGFLVNSFPKVFVSLG